MFRWTLVGKQLLARAVAYKRPLTISRPRPKMGESKNNNNGNWNSNLSPQQLYILKDKGTELPHTGAYLNNNEKGIYHCANCDASLYKSDTKFDAHCGWPAFYQEVSDGALTYHKDVSHGMTRTEICCSNCGGHMGHVFEGEGWDKRAGIPTDTRHCVNSLSLNFKKAKE